MTANCPLPTVSLRAIEPEDLDLLYRIENDVRLWNVGTSNVPYSRYVLHDYVANVTNDIYTDRQVRMMIENEKGQTVGIADLVNFDPANRRAELGLIILNDFRQQGYAMATLEQIHDYARRILHLHQIYVYIDERNEASLNLFRKVDYIESAHIPDWLFDGEKYHDALLFQHVL